MERRLGEHAQAYEAPAPKQFERAAQAGLIAGTALMASRGRTSRAAAAVAGGLMLAGALATRWSIFKAGFASAADPKYVIGPQRAGISAGDRTGAARTQPRVSATTPAG
jgi:hypothetical protein